MHEGYQPIAKLYMHLMLISVSLCHCISKMEKNLTLTKKGFLDLVVAKSLQSTRMVIDDADADDDDVLTTTGYTC